MKTFCSQSSPSAGALFLRAALVALLLSVGGGFGMEPVYADDPGYVISIQFENDFFGGGTDRHFSHGTRIECLTGPIQWITDAADKLPWFSSERARQSPKHDLQARASFSVGQNMYTPEDTIATQLLTDDRPYAGWLYMGFGLVANQGTRRYDKIELEKANTPDFILSAKTQELLLNSLYACPHGVIAWAQDIPNFVETSTNLASVKMHNGFFRIATSQRSSVESAKEDICSMVASVFALTGASITHSDGYPGWTPNPSSPVLDMSVAAYEELFGQKPVVRAIHAGLECGLIGDKYPGMDMISYGPTIRNPHSPGEKLEIATVEKFWVLTLDLLKRIAEKRN